VLGTLLLVRTIRRRGFPAAARFPHRPSHTPPAGYDRSWSSGLIGVLNAGILKGCLHDHIEPIGISAAENRSY